MKRLQYMAARVLQGLIAILLIATVNFLLVRAAPATRSRCSPAKQAPPIRSSSPSCAPSSGSTSRSPPNW